jgi:PhnB protein
MASRLNPYLSFNGDARQAMEFYKSVFGGELTVSTFGDLGSPDADLKDKIMHAQLETSDGYTLMGSDMAPGMPFSPGNTSTVSLSGDDASLRDYFDKLAAGGTVTMPLEKQVWGDEFGRLTDRFGVGQPGVEPINRLPADRAARAVSACLGWSTPASSAGAVFGVPLVINFVSGCRGGRRTTGFWARCPGGARSRRRWGPCGASGAMGVRRFRAGVGA